jgi:hypothetical protein
MAMAVALMNAAVSCVGDDNAKSTDDTPFALPTAEDGSTDATLVDGSPDGTLPDALDVQTEAAAEAEADTAVDASPADVAVDVPGDVTDAGPDAAPDVVVVSMYERLGGHTGLRQMMNDLIGVAYSDPTMISYYTFQRHHAAGHPSTDQVEECMTISIANHLGGDEVYPSDGDGWTCRDLKTLHANFHISQDLENRMLYFVTLVARQYALTADETEALLAAFSFHNDDVVDPTASGLTRFDGG